MPWKECDAMSLRYEFVRLAAAEEANVSLLCKRFGISRKTGYKWLSRYRSLGLGGLSDRSRRPGTSPARTPASMESAVLALRRRHPSWGGRKLRRRLEDLGHVTVPAASTITDILRRHGQISEEASASRKRCWQRFERLSPNDLWQMDFKGEFRLATQAYSYPLTVLDDHSRFNVVLRHCSGPKRSEVKVALKSAFRQYGLPAAILSDNGVPWCARHSGSLTRLALWLVRLGIEVIHGRSSHPQTQGKDERFHRTLKAEVLSGRRFRDGVHVQSEFDRWRLVYNFQRPHEALDMATPSSRYQASARTYPETLPSVEYEPNSILRKVCSGMVCYAGRKIWIGKTLDGERVAIRPGEGQSIRIAYGSFEIAVADLGSIGPGEYGRARLFTSLRCATLREQPGPTDDRDV